MNEVSGGTLYNTQAFINESGDIVGVRRKLLPTLQEKMLYGQGDGSDLSVFELGERRIGGLICFCIGPAEALAPGARICQARADTFPNKLPFEFRDRREQMRLHPAH